MAKHRKTPLTRDRNTAPAIVARVNWDRGVIRIWRDRNHAPRHATPTGRATVKSHAA